MSHALAHYHRAVDEMIDEIDEASHTTEMR